MYRRAYCSHTGMMSSQSAQLFMRMQKAHDIHMLRSRSLVIDVIRLLMLVLHATPRMDNLQFSVAHCISLTDEEEWKISGDSAIQILKSRMHALDPAICRCCSDHGQVNLTFLAAASCHMYIASQYWLQGKRGQTQSCDLPRRPLYHSLPPVQFAVRYLSCCNVEDDHSLSNRSPRQGSSGGQAGRRHFAAAA